MPWKKIQTLARPVDIICNVHHAVRLYYIHRTRSNLSFLSESTNILAKKRLKMFVNKMLIRSEKLRNSCSTVEGAAINLSLRNAKASHVRFHPSILWVIYRLEKFCNNVSLARSSTALLNRACFIYNEDLVVRLQIISCLLCCNFFRVRKIVKCAFAISFLLPFRTHVLRPNAALFSDALWSEFRFSSANFSAKLFNCT